jgi:hypothetical protein
MSSSPTINVAQISSAATAIGALANLILASPTSTQGYQPQNPPGANGTNLLTGTPSTLMFHYEGEQTATFESEITDHYIEDNTAIQDQIALKPTLITTRGYIGELNNILPSFFLPLQAAANSLLLVDAYTPALTQKAETDYLDAVLAYETADTLVNAAVEAVTSIANAFGGPDAGEIGSNTNVFTVGSSQQNLQQQMFQSFYGYWNSRTLFNVQTPWAIFDNMAIQSVKAIQDAETQVISTFEVTFKQIRTTSTSSTDTSLLSSGRAATQSAAGTDGGTSTASGSADQGSAISDTQ